MKSLAVSAVLLLLVAVYLSVYLIRREGFIGSPDAQMCGVDQPPCPFGEVCANGYCINPNPPKLPPTTGLPVLP